MFNNYETFILLQINKAAAIYAPKPPFGLIFDTRYCIIFPIQQDNPVEEAGKVNISIPIEQINMPSDIRVMNELRVLELFRGGGTLTAPEIQAATGISKPTVMKILQRLCQGGHIRSAGFGSSTSSGGKKPELFVFADARRILNISFWPDSTALSLSGLAGDVEKPEELPHTLSSNLDAELLWLSEESGAFLQRRGCRLSDLYAVAVSTSGTVDFHNYILRYNSQAPQWGSNVHLRSYLEQYLSSVGLYMLENAGKITGRAALVDDPALHERRVLTIFTTWGVSGCLIENGRVLNGKDFLIGEIGHMTVDRDDEVCGCGRTGCLERMVSIERVRRLAAEYGAEWYDGERPFGFEELFGLSKNGDPAARRIVDYLAGCFSIMLHNMSLAYNPEVIIFQGSFALADAYFDKCLRSKLASFRYSSEAGIDIRYDRQPLFLQAAKGGTDMIRKYYFSGHCFDA